MYSRAPDQSVVVVPVKDYSKFASVDARGLVVCIPRNASFNRIHTCERDGSPRRQTHREMLYTRAGKVIHNDVCL